MNGTRFAVALVAACLLGTADARAETLSGQARLIDGDTVEIAGRMVRLEGIDAPETGQRCFDGRDRAYLCGVEALDGLRSLIGGAAVRCAGDETDLYGRLIATCHARGLELNREMVRRGHAVAFRQYSDTYLAEETDAFKAGRGIWRGQFERPYLERRRRWADAVAQSPNGCPIKGNISSRGRIYHTPYSQHYEKTRINTRRGERWFCTEAEALAAGWRAPYR